MAFELIPLPISIIFVLVFGVVWIVVLWKLHKRAKIYSILFWVSLIVAAVSFVAILYPIIANMLA